MTALRWILLVAGLVVIAAIYVIGRRNRRPSANEASLGMRDTFVPQLDQPVRIRERAVDPPITVSGRDYESDSEIIDDLPPMHANDGFPKAHADMLNPPLKAPVYTPMSTSYRPILSDTESSGMTTGAFIAQQSREPVTRKLYEQSSEDKTSDPNELVAPTDERIDPPAVSPPVPPPQPTAARAPKKSATRKIVALRLSAGNERVEGTRLKSLLEAAGLRHGKYSIYHRLHNDESSLFSVASMVEPGTFDVHAMSGVLFPGVTIFTQLPGPIDGSEMLSQMLTCARELEQGIGGLLQDERGLPLTEQRAQRLREDVADFTHLLGQS